MKRTLASLAAGLLMAALSIQSVAAAPGGGGTSFTLSPNPLSITSATGWYGFGLASVTTKKTIALANPALSSDGHFSDTQGGTCWSSYGAYGQRIPAGATCTIGVNFHSLTDGTFSGTLSVAECLKWHLSPTGGIACDKAGAPQSIGLRGTSLSTPADLTIIGVLLGDAGPNGDADYRVDVINQGYTIANPGFHVEGFWSTDDVLDDLDASAGVSVNVGGIPPNGVGMPVFMTSPNPPSAEDQFLIVEVDHGNLVTESDETNNIFIVPLAPH